MSLRRFFLLLINNPHTRSSPKVSDSLARTAKEALHVRGGGQQSGGFSSTDAVHDHVAEGHENYVASFDDD